MRNADARPGMLWLAALFAVACGSSPAPPAENPNPILQQAHTECPAEQSWNGSQCAPALAVAERPCPDGTERRGSECSPLDAVEEAPTDAQYPRPSPLPVRDPRRASAAPRAPELVIQEIQTLLERFEATRGGTPESTAMLRRIADDYAELARTAGSGRAEMRRQAIRRYLLLAKNLPKDCAPPATGCDDEVLYLIAYEHEQAGDLNAARRTYLKLIQDHPGSPYVPYAYFAFGELFYAKSLIDASFWPLAEQTYLQVVKYTETPLLPYSLLRLGQIYDGMGDPKRADAHYRKLKSTYPSTEPASQIPREIR